MEMEEIVKALENHETRIQGLEEYEKKQNGTLQRLEEKIDGLKTWMMGGMLSIILLLLGVILK